MSFVELLPVLVTTFMAGILGSGHCFGMCGGIATGIGALGRTATGRSKLLPALVFNLGRLASYMLLGGILAVVLGSSGKMLHIPDWARILRLLTAVMILLIGLRFLFGLKWLDPLEALGAKLWKRIQNQVVRVSSHPGVSGRLLLGLCWGLIPCGLVYSIVLTAASTAGLVSGSLVMLAFGVGTLPSMLGMAWMSPALGVLMRDQWVRRLIGFSLILLSAWTIFMIFGTSMH